MEEKRLYELLGKKLSGEAAAAELEELNQLLAASPQALYTLETMEQYWRTGDSAADNARREAALERHLKRLPTIAPVRHINTRRRAILIAALTAAAILTVILLLPLQRQQPVIQLAVATKNHQQKMLHLPDGSTVWLNALTTIHYTEGADSIRTVILEGEAYFAVKRDAAHPFVVRTAQMEIRDLGTTFNVKAYPRDMTAEATLVEGSIDVRLNRSKGGAILTVPHQKFTAFAEAMKTTASADNVPKAPVATRTRAVPAFQLSNATTATDTLLAETAWMKNMLVFRHESFGDLATRLERWYGITIKFTDTTPAHYRFTGVLANESIDQTLRELKLMKPFSYTITGNTVIIKK